MSQILTVNNVPFTVATPGDPPGTWGQGTSDWMAEVTTALQSVAVPIPVTPFTIANNTVSLVNIVGLAFDTGTVRAATVRYSIYRRSDSNPSGHSETGTMQLIYDNDALSGSKWGFAVGDVVGNSGVNFSITDGGQVQYTSTDIGTTGYSGLMKFTALNLTQ